MKRKAICLIVCWISVVLMVSGEVVSPGSFQAVICRASSPCMVGSQPLPDQGSSHQDSPMDMTSVASGTPSGLDEAGNNERIDAISAPMNQEQVQSGASSVGSPWISAGSRQAAAGLTGAPGGPGWPVGTSGLNEGAQSNPLQSSPGLVKAGSGSGLGENPALASPMLNFVPFVSAPNTKGSQAPAGGSAGNIYTFNFQNINYGGCQEDISPRTHWNYECFANALQCQLKQMARRARIHEREREENIRLLKQIATGRN